MRALHCRPVQRAVLHGVIEQSSEMAGTRWSACHKPLPAHSSLARLCTLLTVKPKVSAAQVLASQHICKSFTFDRGGKTRHESLNKPSFWKSKRGKTARLCSCCVHRLQHQRTYFRQRHELQPKCRVTCELLFQCGGSAKYGGGSSSRDSTSTKRGRSTQCSGSMIAGSGGG
jgi:hypothetical protein